MVAANPGYVSYDQYDPDIPDWFNGTVTLWFIVLLLNGLSMYAQWSMIAACINLSIVLCYRSGLSDSTASFVGLSVFTVLQCVIWMFEILNGKIRKILKYTITPYIVLWLAFIGILTANGVGRDYPPSIMALILLVISGIVFCLKIYVAVFAPRRNAFEWGADFLAVDY
eukprot:CAMPEP_0202712766 /NCGR_PEP_ID=MMETSP1385-20130828/45193_1 /ASSEMBLY_ACC=CAM_ASM_000861 /TAXON_ID=933848 /ORGANISM="Elphidium margaritaceum" /LENGTH=168 /DNA_ID=CAMNT_0049372897 /DNA_START=451 /DNA_END=957 /DNA_ORIENTATION=+